MNYSTLYQLYVAYLKNNLDNCFDNIISSGIRKILPPPHTAKASGLAEFLQILPTGLLKC